MLYIKLIRERPDFVRQRLATRGAGDEARIDELLKLNEQRRKLVAEVEALKAQRNRASKEIGDALAKKKQAEASIQRQPERSQSSQVIVNSTPEIIITKKEEVR